MTIDPRYSFHLVRRHDDANEREAAYERDKANNWAATNGVRRMKPLTSFSVHDCPAVYETADEALRQARAALKLWRKATHAIIELYDVREYAGDAVKVGRISTFSREELEQRVQKAAL